MKFYNFLLLFFTLSIFGQPNVIIILTDDLGWGDVSYHGGFIPTPNIDKFVSNGVELNRFYANPTCSPTRASLLTGLQYHDEKSEDSMLSFSNELMISLYFLTKVKFIMSFIWPKCTKNHSLSTCPENDCFAQYIKIKETNLA